MTTVAAVVVAPAQVTLTKFGRRQGRAVQVATWVGPALFAPAGLTQVTLSMPSM